MDTARLPSKDSDNINRMQSYMLMSVQCSGPNDICRRGPICTSRFFLKRFLGFDSPRFDRAVIVFTCTIVGCTSFSPCFFILL